MLTYYFSKGSSALAAHILLEEAGATYTAQEVSIAKGAHLTPDFLRINPLGRIPALHTPDGILTENPAILEYIAAAHPSANLMPTTLFQQAKARSLCAYLSATVHVAFAHKNRGARWCDDAAAQIAMQQNVRQNLTACAAYLETQLTGGPWALGQTYSFFVILICSCSGAGWGCVIWTCAPTPSFWPTPPPCAPVPPRALPFWRMGCNRTTWRALHNK